MSQHVPVQIKAPPKPAAVMPTPLLQRTCACGGTPGPEGVCAACRARGQTHGSPGNEHGPEAAHFDQAAPQVEDATHDSAGIGHDFSRVQVRARVPQTVQSKLSVGQPHDHYEQEADRVADDVLRMPEPAAGRTVSTGAPQFRVQRKCAACGGGSSSRSDDDELIQTKELPGHTPQVTPALQTRIHNAVSGGQPLPTPIRSFYESRLGYDFSQVRIHTSDHAAATARAVHARAFTLGRDIVFGSGQYAPATTRGRHLLAHELAHVVQQGGAGNATAPASGGLIQRVINPELDKIESYLSYGIVDWAITDRDAIRALELLKQLPRYQQAVFFSNEKYLTRLRENLPKDRIAELNDIERGLGDIRPASATVEDIRDKLSYGLFDWVVTDKEAIEALEKLKQLPPAQLPVALGSINYSRLLDNLPEDRKQELIDLMAKGLGTGGGRETEERTHPGVVLNSLTFKSDHGFLKDNKADWGSSGPLYGQPEWYMADNKTVSHPISHTKDSAIDVDLSLNILPLNANTAPITITGESDVDFLKFNFAGTMQGGLGQKVSLTSAAKLPNEITAFHNKYITWRMKWQNWDHEIGRTGAHSIFVTMDTPFMPDAVTYRRMEKAVEITAATGTLNPHDMVKNIMFIWGTYNLDVQYSNEWLLADNPDLGAQCIDIVRFVQSVIGTVGCPGTAEAVIVWAHPSAPDHGIETPWGAPGGMSSIPNHPLHPTWSIALLDGDDRPNNFEAALKFTYGGTTRYYPGGVRSVLTTPDQVLRVFSCMVWLTFAGGKNCRIEEVVTNYIGSCTPGIIQCRP